MQRINRASWRIIETILLRYPQRKKEYEAVSYTHLIAKVMRECLIKNNLGFECMVYRIPGEAGYYGARPAADGYYMPAEQNPAYLAK